MSYQPTFAPKVMGVAKFVAFSLVSIGLIVWAAGACSNWWNGRSAKKNAAAATGATSSVTMIVTGYSSTVDQTDSTPYQAASGLSVFDGMVAQNNLPFGTQLQIPEKYGGRVFEVQDRMNSRYTDSESGFQHLDIWFPSRAEAERFGIDTTQVVVLGAQVSASLASRVTPRPTQPARLRNTPALITPAYAPGTCTDRYREVVPDSLAVQDSVAMDASGAFTLFWSASSSAKPLFNEIPWPTNAAGDPLPGVRLRVTYLSGHLDTGIKWDPRTGNHYQDLPNIGRNYNLSSSTFWGYCRQWMASYAAVRYNLADYLGPGQTALVVDLANPAAGIYPFSNGPVEATVQLGQDPVLLYNTPGADGPRMHRAAFRIQLLPAPSR